MKALVRFTIAAVVSGCGSQIPAIDDAGSTGAAGPATTSALPVTAGDGTTLAPTSASTSATADGTSTFTSTGHATSTSTDTDGADSVIFIETPDMGLQCGGGRCDLFAQDCHPQCGKCMGWSNVGDDVWNATRCAPVSRLAVGVGDPCQAEGGPATGLDDCEIGAMCLFVDPVTLEGVCVAMCGGSADTPACPPNERCLIAHDGAVVACLPACDPLLDDCVLGTCVPDRGPWQPGDVDGFACFVDGDAILAGQPCGLINDCVASAACLPSTITGDCGVSPSPCCTSLCDPNAGEPDAPCLPGQVCTRWSDLEGGDPSLDAIGVCAQPA